MMKKMVMLASLAAALAAGASDGISWGLMMQLGHDMWGDGGSVSNRTDRNIWNEVTELAARRTSSSTVRRLPESRRRCRRGKWGLSSA